MLKLYNTLTRKKESFKPLHPPFVGIYVCGPTVYDDTHLGHAKSYISFDVIVRFLRALGYRVRYVQNITDVGHLLGDENGEDRILKKAKIEQMEPVEVAQKYETAYFQDMEKLNCLRPDISCRASGHIPEMIQMTERLIEKGYAYEVDGNVYFEIAKFGEYGKLSGRRIEDMMEGVRIETARGKRHSADFALWKRAEEQHLMQWPSPWGKGFPGWHIECSVMAMKYIGDTIDIHGGGIDNQFPHHECEIAQSESATGKPFVRYWLHNNMVTTEKQKMSKSLGNFVTLKDLFSRYDPMTVRFFILQGHYRSPQVFSEEGLDAAGKGLERLTRTVTEVVNALNGERIQERPEIKGEWKVYRDRFFENMQDDFNTSGALSVLFDLSKEVNQRSVRNLSVGDLGILSALFHELAADILGLRLDTAGSKGRGGDEEALIEILIGLRNNYRERKEWAAADEIRKGLEQIGILLEDGKEGTTLARTKKV